MLIVISWFFPPQLPPFLPIPSQPATPRTSLVRPGRSAALHRRLFAEHRSPEQNKLQHSVCPQDVDDHLSGHGAARVHGLVMDHCLLDLASV